jgi:uncharacterized membrane protein YcgQ (UPF0703/DUF1980 family)
MGSSIMKEYKKDKIIRLYDEGNSPVRIIRMLCVSKATVYAVLSRYKKDIEHSNDEVNYEGNMVLRTINDIFNTNPIIQNPNRMAAY